MLVTLQGKQKYQVTSVGVEKIKLSRLLVQCINEFEMNEIQRKTNTPFTPTKQRLRKLKTIKEKLQLRILCRI